MRLGFAPLREMLLLERIALRWFFVIVDRVEQPADDQVEHRDAMANPDTHRVGACAETRFRFERGATE